MSEISVPFDGGYLRTDEDYGLVFDDGDGTDHLSREQASRVIGKLVSATAERKRPKYLLDRECHTVHRRTGTPAMICMCTSEEMAELVCAALEAYDMGTGSGVQEASDG